MIEPEVRRHLVGLVLHGIQIVVLVIVLLEVVRLDAILSERTERFLAIESRLAILEAKIDKLTLR